MRGSEVHLLVDRVVVFPKQKHLFPPSFPFFPWVFFFPQSEPFIRQYRMSLRTALSATLVGTIAGGFLYFAAREHVQVGLLPLPLTISSSFFLLPFSSSFLSFFFLFFFNLFSFNFVLFLFVFLHVLFGIRLPNFPLLF